MFGPFHLKCTTAQTPSNLLPLDLFISYLAIIAITFIETVKDIKLS
jgi:hypothetical protein